jgi:lysophospholipase L1-like esterase
MDVVALGLAKAEISRRADLLRRRDLPAPVVLTDGEVPTVTASSTTTIASGTTTAVKRIGNVATADADLPGDPSFAIGGTTGLGANPASPTNRVRSAFITGGVARYTPNFRFMTDAPEFEYLGILPGGTFLHRLSVDGRQSIPATALTPGYNDVKVKFAFGSAKTRMIDLAVEDPDFIGIRVASGYNIWRPVQGYRRRLVIVGDSLSAGADGIERISMWPWDLGRLLACDDILNASIGGTGWVSDGSGVANFGNRVATDILPILKSTDIVLFVGSRNDPTGQAASVTSTVNTIVRSVAKAQQTYVAGTFTALTISNDAVKAGAAAAARPFIDASNWITGNGRTGAPNGSGNADRYIGGVSGTDAIHFAPAAIPYIARRFRNAIEAQFPA